MLAGGTGITAFTAFLTGLSSASTQTVLLAYGARKAELLVYRGLIEQCAAQVAGLRTWFYIEDGPLETLQAGNTRIGRLSLDGLWGAIADPGSFTFYLSGPPEMLRSFSSELRERGIGTDAIKVDAWE
jgi:ferredoxin-NADP reductase